MTSVLDHTVQTSTRRRLGAATAAVALLATTGLLLDQSGSANAATAPGLGTADSFAVLAGSALTNTGPTQITGDFGSYSTVPTAVTGDSTIVQPTGVHQTDAGVLGSAKADLLTAFNAAASQASTQTISADLATTLTPGVYTQATAMGLTGTLTLDGDADSVFIFQAGDTLTVNPNSRVLLTGGVQACNVFWQVAVSATLDTDVDFVGTIMAGTSITLNDRASVTGRVLASNGAVTMIDNVITRPTCATPTTTTPTPPSATAAPSPTATPAPATPGTGAPAGSTATGGGTGTSAPNGSTSGTARQVPRVPVGSVDAGDGSSTRTSDTGE